MRFTDSVAHLWWLRGTAIIGAGSILFWGATTSPFSAYDDAFITYRYAANIAQGHGLVYTPNEWVLGTTTPLYAFLLGLLAITGLDIPTLSHWLTVIFWIFALWCAMGLLYQESGPRSSLIAALLMAFYPTLLLNLGMEIALVVALMLATALVWLQGRRYLLIPLAAALLLTRQDSALWLLILGLAVWHQRRRFPWLEVAGVLALATPWFIYSYLRYGTVLPHSAIAKIGQASTMSVAGDPSYVEALVGFMQNPLLPWLVWMLIAAAGVGVYASFRLRILHWLPVWLAAYIVIYSLLGVVNFSWYFVPPMTAIYLLAALGIGAYLGDAPELAQLSRRHFIIPAAIVGLLALTANQVIAFSKVYQGEQAGLQLGRWPYYRATADWLAIQTPADATVATIEIGILGYYSKRPILDTMGLTSPGIRPYLTGWTDSVVYALSRYRPDYTVTIPDTAWDGIIGQWWFAERYTPLAEFPPVTVYGRRTVLPGYRSAANLAYTQGLVLQSLDLPNQELTPGEELRWWAQFDLAAAPPSNYQFTWYLADAQTYTRVAQENQWPYAEFNLYPSSHWRPGLLAVPFRLTLPEALPPGAYRLGLVIFDSAAQRPLTLETGADDVQMAWLRSGDLPSLALTLPRRVPVATTWRNVLELKQLALSNRALVPGSSLPLQLQWRVIQPLEQDVKLFVHLVAADGSIVAQQDLVPFDGRFPFPVWRANETPSLQVEINLPSTLASGSYALRIGLYDAQGRLLTDTGQDSLYLPELFLVE